MAVLVFGTGGTIELSALDGSNGFVLNGIDNGDNSGVSVSSAGDVNGDGFDDIIIGAYLADPNSNLSAGESYLVFGGTGIGTGGTLSLSALDGSNGFVLNGIDGNDNSGVSVSSAGDVNNDGFDDIIIGARGADPNNSSAGESYLVFGGTGIGTGGEIELSALDGTNGFVLNGIDNADFSGTSVSSAGDVNNDGFDDIIIGANSADPNDRSSGESYLVFGGTGIGTDGTIELSALDGSNGFVLNGIDERDNSGRSVSSAGDVNNDGIDDIIIGAYEGDPNGNDEAGESYVVFGGTGIGTGGTIELSALDGTNGFVLNGINFEDYSGYSVSNAGDINNDGVDDIIIGAYRADPNGSTSGESYVVFGIADNTAPDNTAPDAVDDSFSTNESTPLIGIDVLANDTDADGDTLSITALDTTGTAGIVTDNGDGTVDYDPNGQFDALNAGETDTDSFSYTIDDGNGGTDTATVNITIDGIDNVAPSPFVINEVDADTTSFDQAEFIELFDGGVGNSSLDGLALVFFDGNDDASYEAFDLDGFSTNAEGFFVLGNPGVANVDLTFAPGSRGALQNGADAVALYQANATDFTNNTPVTTVNLIDAVVYDTDDGDDSGLLSGLGQTIQFNEDENNNRETESNSRLPDGTGSFETQVPTPGTSNQFSDDGSTDDNLIGTGQKDTLDGGGGNDTLDGLGASDLLIGGNGSDSLIGGGGNDTLDGGRGQDTLLGGNGKDSLIGGNANDILDGGRGQDTLLGENGNDSLDGGRGQDLLFGGDGVDTLIGGNGKDTLDGGAKNDTLSGGNGSDTFVLAAGSGTDTIEDFGNQDLIGLSGGIGFNDLSFAGNDIILSSTNEVLATLTGVETTDLTSSDFTTV